MREMKLVKAVVWALVASVGVAGGVGAQASARRAPVATSEASAAQTGQSWVKVEDAWIRATTAGQKVTGGFMNLTSTQSMTLVGFETPVAKHAELHEMAMQGDVMRMRAIDALPLPAGTVVSLKPGAHHMMLTDLTRPLTEGDNVSVTLLLKGADGQLRKQVVSIPVKAPQMAHPHSGHDQHAQ